MPLCPIGWDILDSWIKVFIVAPYIKRNLSLFSRRHVMSILSMHPTRGATMSQRLSLSWLSFQSTHLTRGATKTRLKRIRQKLDFNPRTSHEVRPYQAEIQAHQQNFNPRTSHEVRLSDSIGSASVNISIHAPHTRCDLAIK